MESVHKGQHKSKNKGQENKIRKNKRLKDSLTFWAFVGPSLRYSKIFRWKYVLGRFSKACTRYLG